MTDELRRSHRRGEVIRDAYVLGDVLGIGGMGIVYAATQTSNHRTVAVKLPKPQLVDDAEVRRQFDTEAMMGARIQHRNVVGVVDFGLHAHAPFLVMEHVVGPRLGEVVTDRGPLPLALAANLVHQVLAGLAYVHTTGIIHGDVKCDNILVEALRDGSSIPRLMDFGFARFAHEKPLHRDVRAVVVTPDYVAPELVHGGPTSFASDVYAVGIMCYELVTGETPFAGGPAERVLERHLSDFAPPLSSRRPRVPISLDAFVARALEKRPSDRFVNALEMRDALAEVAVELATSLARQEDASPVSCTSEETTAPLHIDQDPTNKPLTRIEPRAPR